MLPSSTAQHVELRLKPEMLQSVVLLWQVPRVLS
jgi:hypothetical protein